MRGSGENCGWESRESMRVKSEEATLVSETRYVHCRVPLKLALADQGDLALQNLPTMFGALHHDLSLYTHLAITLRPSGEPSTLKHWFVNIQTDGPVRSDLFQHRLPLSTSQLLQGKGYNQWQTVHVPLNGFVLTNSGTLSDTQIPMMKNKIRTVGFSILGGGREPGGPSTGLETGRRGSYPELDMVEDDLTPEAKEARDESLRPTSLRPDEKPADEEEHGAAMLGGIEGKFELGIREVRAVNLDVDSNGEAGELILANIVMSNKALTIISSQV